KRCSSSPAARSRQASCSSPSRRNPRYPRLYVCKGSFSQGFGKSSLFLRAVKKALPAAGESPKAQKEGGRGLFAGPASQRCRSSRGISKKGRGVRRSPAAGKARRFCRGRPKQKGKKGFSLESGQKMWYDKFLKGEKTRRGPAPRFPPGI